MATNKSAPLYQQIYEDIKSAIKDGVYKVDEKIPSEAELSEEYGVSRITVRRAIEDLCADGYLTKMQGRGTFVGKPHIMRRLSQSKATRSFSEICREAGVTPGAHLIERQIVPVRPDEQEFFGLGPDAWGPTLCSSTCTASAPPTASASATRTCSSRMTTVVTC